MATDVWRNPLSWHLYADAIQAFDEYQDEDTPAKVNLTLFRLHSRSRDSALLPVTSP